MTKTYVTISASAPIADASQSHGRSLKRNPKSGSRFSEKLRDQTKI